MAADAVTSQDIENQLGISRPTIQLWRERFLALRVAGLEKDAPRPGRIPSIPEEKFAQSLKPRCIQNHPLQPIGARGP
jgi:hypothetical protein